MIKQLKAYELEDAVDLPGIDYDDWSNPVVTELAEMNFPFLNRMLLSKGATFRVSDLIDNKHEIMHAYKTPFKNLDTAHYIASVFKMYMITDQLIEFSNLEESEDIIVISHISKGGKDYLGLYILKKIMDVIISEREVLEVIGKELLAFDYPKLASIVLSEDQMFNLEYLATARGEIDHALKHKLVSHKSIHFINFLKKLSDGNKQKEIVFLMDLVKLPIDVK
jgi:hypothetical protein